MLCHPPLPPSIPVQCVMKALYSNASELQYTCSQLAAGCVWGGRDTHLKHLWYPLHTTTNRSCGSQGSAGLGNLNTSFRNMGEVWTHKYWAPALQCNTAEPLLTQSPITCHRSLHQSTTALPATIQLYRINNAKPQPSLYSDSPCIYIYTDTHRITHSQLAVSLVNKCFSYQGKLIQVIKVLQGKSSTEPEALGSASTIYIKYHTILFYTSSFERLCTFSH